MKVNLFICFLFLTLCGQIVTIFQFMAPILVNRQTTSKYPTRQSTKIITGSNSHLVFKVDNKKKPKNTDVLRQISNYMKRKKNTNIVGK